ncbi:MAG: ferrous iron transport protein B [Gammaproteobacteria bacterium]|nr:ferrous iron transport protein B [Gammaproteobacteria bacterium]
MQESPKASIPIPKHLFTGDQRLRIALVGMPNSGKSTLFQAVSSTAIYKGELSGTHREYNACNISVNLDEASLIDLPSLSSLQHMTEDERGALKYLLWGNERPPISAHEPDGPPTPFSPPNVIIQVVDATSLERHLELTLQLSQLGRPMVIALNMMDEARKKGLHINTHALSLQLGIPVVPTVAFMGQGLSELFNEAITVARNNTCPLPQPISSHIEQSLQPLSQLLNQPEIHSAFRVPHTFLLSQLASGDEYFFDELEQHFPQLHPEIRRLHTKAGEQLPRPLADEVHADRHHQAATLFESSTRLGAGYKKHSWRYWLDELFLHPQWGLIGTLAVFALVLFFVFEVSGWLDSITAAKLIEALSDWQPESIASVIARGVVDGLIGLVGIVIPYMIPFVMLLIVLEQIGIMQRIAFVVDRGFHHIGLHGGVAVSFLLGLGCNVPAISAAARASQGRDRVVSALLITFVPCSARSAIILALAGKYLGGFGVFCIFMLSILIISLVGNLLTRRYPNPPPGPVLEIPAYALPRLGSLLSITWDRTRDILTIVTPLLILGSIVLALLNYYSTDQIINTMLTPITSWWLGLPVVLGVPLLFGVLRKELSLLMVFQALGTFEIAPLMDWIQITTFLIFVTFYVPCVATFAVMYKTIGRKEAFFSITLSITAALLASGVVRLILEIIRGLTG